jgi:Fungal chitosanase of glycosyl hydrolase group 75
MSKSTLQSNFKLLTNIGGTDIWQMQNALDASAFFFEGGLSVDADGAPSAYGPVNAPGTLDYLANAGHPGDWYGVVTRNGQPVVQSGVPPSQPCRGLYISTTSLQNNIIFDSTDVRRYVDATKVPYIALPPRALHRTAASLGDLALLINAVSGKYCFAIYADNKGNKNPKVGEVSIFASGAIGGPTDARKGSIARGIFTMVFPQSGIGQGSIPGADVIALIGRSALQHFSVFRDPDNKLLAAYPEYPNFSRALKYAGYPT